MQIVSRYKTVIEPCKQTTNYIVGASLLDNLDKLIKSRDHNYSKFLILTDETAFRLFGKKILSSVGKLNKPIVVSQIISSEQTKDIDKIRVIVKPYFRIGFDRSACLICLGGGVVTDIGGFISSILLRGIDCIFIPTTLLAQVDAAIGGKTGVNFQDSGIIYKNMLGAFYQPKMVISDVYTIATLPQREIISGLGEIVKYWIGWGQPSVNQLFMLEKAIKSPERWPKDSSQVEELVKTISLCQRIKIDVVKQDPFETTGIRQKLNLGHTIGHAAEGASGGKLTHGESVSIGLAAAAKISFLKNLCDERTYRKIISVLRLLGLPVNFHVTMYRYMVTKKDIVKSVKSALKLDKKSGTFVLIEEIGKLRTGVSVEMEIINQVLEEIIQ